MSMDVARTVLGAPTRPVASPASFPDDQLYMLKLCLELQVEALLLALGSSAVSARGDRAGAPARRDAVAGVAHPSALPWETWLAEDLELACALTRDCVEDDIPLPSSMGLIGGEDRVAESLAARYSAMAAVVGEMLERTDPHDHPAAVLRLTQTRTRCEERLDALLGETAKTLPFPPPVVAPEAGHFLG